MTRKVKKLEPSIQALKLFAALADTGKLTRAARRVAMSQSAASHALRALETNTGAKLLVRERGGLKLSETGLRLLPHVRRILESLEALRQESSSLVQLQSGVLRLASVSSVAATILPRLMREFTTRYPGIEISLFEGTDDEVRQWVLTGMAHVGFAAIPVDGLLSEELLRDEWVALVPEALFRGRRSISLKSLTRHNFLMSGGGCEPRIRALFVDAKLETPAYTAVKELPTIEAMVAERLGVSVIPSLWPRVAKKGTRTLALAPRQTRTVGMLRSPDGPVTPAMEAWWALARGVHGSGVPVGKLGVGQQ